MINNEVTQPIIHSIARMLKALHFDYDSFNEALREDYVKTVHADCRHMMETALMCGIDRRAVDAILKQRNINNKRAIMMMVVEEVQTYLDNKNQERANLNLPPDQTMLKYGSNSIDNIVKDKANGATTTITVLNCLVKIGVIKDIGPRFVFLGYPPPQATARDKLTIKFSEDLKLLVNDYAYQMRMVSKLYKKKHRDI